MPIFPVGFVLPVSQGELKRFNILITDLAYWYRKEPKTVKDWLKKQLKTNKSTNDFTYQEYKTAVLILQHAKTLYLQTPK